MVLEYVESLSGIVEDLTDIILILVFELYVIIYYFIGEIEKSTWEKGRKWQISD